MSSSPPRPSPRNINPNSSSSPAPSSPPTAHPLRSSALLANPIQRAFLITDGGLNQLVTRQEARSFFEMGYTPRDPETRVPVDVGGTDVPRYAEGEGAFVREEDVIRGLLGNMLIISVGEESQREGKGGNGGMNGAGPKDDGEGRGGGERQKDGRSSIMSEWTDSILTHGRDYMEDNNTLACCFTVSLP
ncbi:uncharacterized protein BDR25DRAFT_348454 [Lindgomyces ingoldianus]|uniref:Uncharacterized protein n=1 Tax=Lindgomyces ingoldianus TaxID=673940 RepID=A0ACB6RGF6_9PLEO|nr:uncharacterized protein BDR25DRAFT_348454 [Lindgomyces ingoldianus]KAF2478196.1 hypothetical protein BDR25DRAFT_348454 [Lindgomyces ingoldianus]